MEQRGNNENLISIQFNTLYFFIIKTQCKTYEAYWKEKADYEKCELEGCSPRNLHNRTTQKDTQNYVSKIKQNYNTCRNLGYNLCPTQAHIRTHACTHTHTHTHTHRTITHKHKTFMHRQCQNVYNMMDEIQLLI